MFDKIITDKFLWDFAKTLQKVAQDQPKSFTISPTSVAKKLVNKLTREFANKSTSANISTDLPESDAVNPTNLGTIDKLIQYLSKNKIKADGQQIAFNANEYQSLSDEVKNTLSKFSAKLSRDSSTLRWNDDDFWINVNALTKYIAYLQEKADTMLRIQNNPEGKLLQVQTNKLVSELNSRINSNSGLTPKAKGSPTTPAELPPETPVDSFSDNKILDPKSPSSDNGPRQLFVKNLASKVSLNEWLEGGAEWGGPATVISYDVHGTPTKLPFTDDKSDDCSMINALYQRAINKVRRAKSTEEEKIANYYLNKIKELSSAFTNPNNKTCTITSNPANNSTPSESPAPGVNLGNNTSANTIQQMAQALPLDPENIDFHRINYFFELYNNILSSSDSPRKTEIENDINDAKHYMNIVTSMTKDADQVFNLSETPQGISDILDHTKGPVITMYKPFLMNLQYIVSRVAAVISSFYAQYVRKNPGENTRVVLNDYERNMVDAQITGDNSYKMRNIYRLNSLLSGATKFIS